MGLIFLIFPQAWHWNMVNPPICTRSIVAMSNLCHYTRHLHKVYKAKSLTVQGCIRVLEGFQMILRNSLGYFPFLRMRDVSHTYWLIMCNPCIYLTSYMFITLTCIHKWWLVIHGWVWFHFFFLPLFLSHDNGNIVTPPICTHCIIGVCKYASVQDIYTKYTKVRVLTIQGYTKQPILKDFKEFWRTCSLIAPLNFIIHNL